MSRERNLASTVLSGRFVPVALRIGAALVSILPVMLVSRVAASGQGQRFIMMAPPVQATSPAYRPARPARARASAAIRHAPLPDKFVFSSDLLFEPAKDLLTPAGEARLKGIVAELKPSAELHPLIVVAHIDNLGFESYNLDLTKRRAERVKNWLVAHGVAKSETITARGAGSSPYGEMKVAVEHAGAKRHVASVKHFGPAKSGDGKTTGQPLYNNRVVEVAVDLEHEIEPEVVAAKPGPLVESDTSKQASGTDNSALPAELREALGGDGMTLVPASEADLMPQYDLEKLNQGNAPAGHITNSSEWGGGGTDFGDKIKAFGGENAQINEDGKRVIKVAPAAELQEKQRKETIEAQNEFGLWRDP